MAASTDTSPPLVPPAQEEPISSTVAVPAEKPISTSEDIKPATIISEAPKDISASSTELPISVEEPTTEKHVVEAQAEENPAIETSTTTEAEENPTIEPSATAEAEPVLHESQKRELPEDTIEESYYLRDLKESQKKALLQLKAKIQAAIMDNTFLDPPKPVKTKKEDVEEEEKKVEAEEEGEKTEGTKEEDGQATIEPPPNTPATEEPSIDGKKEDGEATIEPPINTPADEQPSIDEQAVKEVFESTREVTLEPTPPEDELVVPPPEDDSPSLEDLALWGIPLLHSKGDERTDVLLLKFLRARDFKVGKALNMLQGTMAWRKEFNADDLIEGETPADFHGSFIHGVDREGHPVCYNGELSSKKSVDYEAQVKSRIQVLEKGIQALDFSPNGVHSMVQVIDFSGHSLAFLGQGVRSKILDLLQNNYPELVSKQIFINVPWYFPPLLSFFNPRMKSKIALAKPGRVAETLFKYISPDQVPVQYGGLSRPNDIEVAGIEAPVTQLVVKAGEKQSIELPVPNASRLVWDISVVGWEVVYDEEFVPNEGYVKIIRKANRVAANEEPLRNSFATDEPGKMVMTIDNTTSRRRRVVVYRCAVIAS